MKYILLLTIICGSIYGVSVTEIQAETIVGNIGVPICQNALIEGVVRIPDTKNGSIYIDIAKVNDAHLPKTISMELSCGQTSENKKFSNGQSLLFVGHEVIFIGRGYGKVPNSKGLDQVLTNKYAVIPKESEITVQTNWTDFEVRSMIIFDAHARKGG